MPYRIDLADASSETLDLLVALGVLDAEPLEGGGLAALMPDSVARERVAQALGLDHVTVTPATGRDADSVWVVTPRPVRVGALTIVPAESAAAPDALRLVDAPAFGTGLHPTTAMCLGAIEERLQSGVPEAMLDVGTGSGILALAALRLGVARVTAIDSDDAALAAASENARINGLTDRLELARGGPEMVAGRWPLVVANVLAAPLIEMAPALVSRVGHDGELVLSGIQASAEPDVDQAYRRLGMQRMRTTARAGWVALVLRASW